jgi:hypothetical protein
MNELIATSPRLAYIYPWILLPWPSHSNLRAACGFSQVFNGPRSHGGDARWGARRESEERERGERARRESSVGKADAELRDICPKRESGTPFSTVVDPIAGVGSGLGT